MPTLLQRIQNIPSIIANWWQEMREAYSAATVTQEFGPSTLSGEPSYMGYPNFHKGVDLVFPGGTRAEIYAPASGRVTVAGNHGGFGNAVVIQAPNGFKYLLGHLSRVRVAAGQYVTAGDAVGWQGSTGYSTGVHTHLEITDPTGRAVDPGDTWDEIWWSIEHGLGWGQGYNELHTYEPPPAFGSPRSREYRLPPSPWNSGIPVGEPWAGEPVPPGPVTDPPPVDPSGVIGFVQGQDREWQVNVLGSFIIVPAAILLMIIGLTKIKPDGDASLGQLIALAITKGRKVAA